MVVIQKVLEVKQNHWCDFSVVGCAEQPAGGDTIRAVLDKTASVKLPTTKVKLIIMWMEFVCYSRQKLHNFWRKCNSEIQSRRKRCVSWHQSPNDLGFYKSYHIPIKYFCNAVSLHALERLLKSFTDLNLKFETFQSSTLCFETHIFGSRTFSSSFLSALSCDRPHCRTCSHFIKATWMCLMGRRHRG